MSLPTFLLYSSKQCIRPQHPGTPLLSVPTAVLVDQAFSFPYFRTVDSCILVSSKGNVHILVSYSLEKSVSLVQMGVTLHFICGDPDGSSGVPLACEETVAVGTSTSLK